MAFIRKDRVMELSTSTGVGPLTLGGAITGYRALANVCANGDMVPYSVWGVNSLGSPTGEWETGLGTWNTGGTLTRTQVIASSNGNNAVNFTSGTKFVAISGTDVGMLRHPDSLVLPKSAGYGIKIDPLAPVWTWKDKEGLLYPDAIAGAVRGQFHTGVFKWSYVNNKELDFSIHIPHDIVPNSDTHLHIHWAHNATAVSGPVVFNWNITYSKGHNQQNFITPITPSLSYNLTNIATTPRHRQRIDEFALSVGGGGPNQLNSNDLEPDGLIEGTVALDLSGATITGASPVNSLYIFTIDLHYQSTNIGSLNRTPNFYA